MKYRADVDGLRAIAVSLVVLYHFHLGPVVGGYIGVDVFFVISGYLITNVLWREISVGDFSIARFCERRVRRIFPPLILVVAATLLAAWFILLPSDYVSLSKQSLSALFAVSNFYFWSEADYFARSSNLSPLLHTWSLSVEEQFYLAWPLILMAAWRAGNSTSIRAIKITVSTIIVTSLMWSIVKVFSSPATAFYVPIFRAWELAIGGLLVFVSPIRGRLLSEVAPLVGLVVIVTTALLITSDNLFPGALALLPCVGAALIVWPRLEESSTARLLSRAPMVWVGRLSYSIYLWHWPLLVLYRHENYGNYPDLGMSLVLIGATSLFSFLTWLLVEQTARDRLKVSRRRLVLIGAPAICAVGIAAISVIAAGGFAGRLPSDVVLDMDQLRSPIRETCHLRRLTELPRNENCILGYPATVPDTIVWGDSHGVELSDALADRFKGDKRSLITLTISACPPVVGYSLGDRSRCAEGNERIIGHILHELPSVHTVVLASYHFFHYRRAGDQYASGLTKTVLRLVSGGKRVLVVGPIPEFSDSVPLVSARMAWRGIDRGPAIERADWDEQLTSISPVLDPISKIGGAEVVNVSSVFCDLQLCRFSKNGRPLLFDSNHPSMDAAALIADRVYKSILLDDQPASTIAAKR